MSKICVNNRVLDLDSGIEYLVLWLSPNNGWGYWYSLSGRSRKPNDFIIEDIIKGETNGRYEIKPPQISEAKNVEDTLTEKERIHRDKIWNIMQFIVESEPEIYDTRQRYKLLRQAANVNGIDPTNIYRWLDMYWRSGKTKNAYIPGYSKCGGKGNRRKTYSKNTSYDVQNGKIIDDEDRRNFQKAINSYYLTRNKTSLRVTYEKLLQDFYTEKRDTSNDNARLKLLPSNDIPTFRQFSYWYSKSRDAVKETIKREGESQYNLNNRSLLGRSDYGLMGPGAQFQIDATVGDIYLVSRFDRNNLIGRPVIYFIVDTFSRMVTGMSISLEGPSWAGASLALTNMAANKVAYCKQYGITITENEWPCHHVPASLLCDRGEMESKNADNLVNALGIRIVNAPPFRADLKGVIEQQFRTINTDTIALLPGSVKPDMSKRGGNDYRLDAILDIDQLTQIIIKCVLYYNNTHYMEYFDKNEAMIRDGVEAIPIRIWEWGVRNYSGALRAFTEEQVRLAVLPLSKATITAKGIRFKGILYSCDRAVREAWFEKARAGGTRQVTAAYDPRDMTNLYIWNSDNEKYDICTLLEWNQKYTGKYLDEISYEQQKEKLYEKRLKHTETEAKVNLNADVETIVNEAKKMSAGQPDKSKSERVSQISYNRGIEREGLRREARLSEEPVQQEESIQRQKSSDDELTPVMRMIKRKLEESLKND